MHSMLCGHVSVCVCVRMCACILLYRMCFLLLAWRWALPHDWLVVPVMSRRAQRWNEIAAVLPLLVSSCLRVPTSFFFSLWTKRASCWPVSLEPVHFGFQLCSTLVENWSSIAPRGFRGNVFSDNGNVFFGNTVDCLIALCSSSTTQSLTFSSLVTFSTFFHRFPK